MKTKILMLACAIFLIPTLSQAQKWTKVKSKEGKFEIEFPAEPKLDKKEKEDSKTYQYQLTHNDVIYMASAVVHDTPLNVKGLTSESLAESSLDAFAGVMGGKITKKEDFTLGKNKGKACTIENKEKGFKCYYKCIIIGQIQYQFIVMNAPSADDKKSRTQYFKSIKTK